jgi:hypothetical protein
VLVGPEDPSDHATMSYTNSIIGPYTNRIPTGEHSLFMDNQNAHRWCLLGTHTLKSPRHPSITSTLNTSANSPEANQAVCLHSGPGSEPWDKQVFEVRPPFFRSLPGCFLCRMLFLPLCR